MSAELIAQARALMRKGDLLGAVDLLEGAPGLEAPELQLEGDYVRALALARSGAPRAALALFQQRLAGKKLEILPPQLRSDIAALEARCLKDLASEAADQRPGLKHAAQVYAQVHRLFGKTYPLINAATLFYLAGERDEAMTLARQVLRELPDDKDATGYWGAATEAEALLILGEYDRAEEMLAKIAQMAPAPSDLASTKRQLRTLCAAAGDRALQALGKLPALAIVHYCGSADALPQHCDWQEMFSRIPRQAPVCAFGSLAAGCEILMAEAALAAGVELHVVLPFSPEAFVRRSVASAGADWVDRFHGCLARAATVTLILKDDTLAGEQLQAMSSGLAMGLARQRAQTLLADVYQVALGEADASVARWLSHGLDSFLVGKGGVRQVRETPPPGEVVAEEGPIAARSFLFADVRGFSKLDESLLKPFVESYMGGIAAAIAPFAADIDYIETAGDGIYLVFRTPVQAVECALRMQAAADGLDEKTLGAARDLSLRVAIHHGLAQPVSDPITGRRKFVGREIIRAARMEPVTPPGRIYVTEQMAGAVFLEGGENYLCDYAGIVSSAKDYGRFRMYALRRDPAVLSSFQPNISMPPSSRKA